MAEAIQGYGSRSVGAACSYLSRPGSKGDNVDFLLFLLY